MIVSFAFGSVSALGVHFGFESALGVHSLGSSWEGLERNVASWICRRFARLPPTRHHMGALLGTAGLHSTKQHICQLCFWFGFGFGRPLWFGISFGYPVHWQFLGRSWAKRGKQDLSPFASLPPTRHDMGALPGPAGLHLMKQNICKLCFWLGFGFGRPLWFGISFGCPLCRQFLGRSWAKRGKQDLSPIA